MYKDLHEVFPEIEWVYDKKMCQQIVTVYEDALQIGNWKLEDMDTLPFTLKISGTPISYRTHVRAVTRMAKLIYKEYHEHYDAAYNLDHDTLLTGALLHDVGKLLEYTKKPDGTLVKSDMGKNLRHPFSGTGLAMKHGLPSAVSHIIANHAVEGDGTLRSPEAVVINKVDLINFDTIRACLGMI